MLCDPEPATQLLCASTFLRVKWDNTCQKIMRISSEVCKGRSPEHSQPSSLSVKCPAPVPSPEPHRHSLPAQDILSPLLLGTASGLPRAADPQGPSVLGRLSLGLPCWAQLGGGLSRSTGPHAPTPTRMLGWTRSAAAPSSAPPSPEHPRRPGSRSPGAACSSLARGLGAGHSRSSLAPGWALAVSFPTAACVAAAYE